ncbi:MAG: LysM peptidoglycan-binding domain-containing protein [Anaerolineales bacterium]
MKPVRLFLPLVVLVSLLWSMPPVAAQSGGTYVVQAGDTLFGIARRQGVDVGTLAAVNGLTTDSWIYTGQRLSLPGSVSAPAPAPASGENVHLVQQDETLLGIALRHGVRVSRLARANGLAWNAWVYAGQRLVIPGEEDVPAPASGEPEPAPTAVDGVYVVRAGDTLFSIARRHGTTVAALMRANGLSSNTIYTGQQLQLTGGEAGPAPEPPATQPPAGHGSAGEKWIDINLTTQRVTAYEGQTAVWSALASTGTWRTPTVVGTYQILSKYPSTHMSGPGYSLPNVPYTMFFYRGYAFHGTYWHNNFGTPMSHGCVNLSTPDSEWLYNWAPVGTKVVSHY